MRKRLHGGAEQHRQRGGYRNFSDRVSIKVKLKIRKQWNWALGFVGGFVTWAHFTPDARNESCFPGQFNSCTSPSSVSLLFLAHSLNFITKDTFMLPSCPGTYPTNNLWINRQISMKVGMNIKLLEASSPLYRSSVSTANMTVVRTHKLGVTTAPFTTGAEMWCEKIFKNYAPFGNMIFVKCKTAIWRWRKICIQLSVLWR